LNNTTSHGGEVSLVSKGDENSIPSTTNRAPEIWRFLSEELKTLSSKLHKVGETKAMKPYLSSGAQLQMKGGTGKNDGMEELMTAVSRLKTTAAAGAETTSNDQSESVHLIPDFFFLLSCCCCCCCCCLFFLSFFSFFRLKNAISLNRLKFIPFQLVNSDYLSSHLDVISIIFHR
jgi:hypothetical protein